MKKSLVVVLVFLTAVCLFAADSPWSVGAGVGFITDGTAVLKVKDNPALKKEGVKYTGFTLNVNGSYEVDKNYSVEGELNLVLPSKAKVTLNKDTKEYSKSDFKKGFGYKINAGVGYNLKVDTPFDVKVGGGLSFGNVSFNKLNNKAFTFGAYGFGAALFPVAKNISVDVRANLYLNLYGKTEHESGLMFKPGFGMTAGAKYSF